MVIVFYLAVLQTLLVFAHCTRFTTFRQKHSLFNNPVDRLSTGFGKRAHGYHGTPKQDEATEMYTDLERLIATESRVLLDNIMGRLSSGYGKRTKELLQKLNVLGQQGYLENNAVDDDGTNDFAKERLIDILKFDINRGRDRKRVDSQNINLLPYVDDDMDFR